MIRTDATAAPLTRPDGTPIRILAVDDESSLTELLSMAMRYEGWQVSTAASGGQAVKVAREARPDAIVLDMMLPDFDGLEVMRRIRAEDPHVPVIFLTAKDSVEDRIGGLTAGGDDYVTKPFSLEEVIARLRALLRRSGAALARSDSTLVVGDLTLDEDSHEVRRAGVEIQLTATEFELLRYLMRNPPGAQQGTDLGSGVELRLRRPSERRRALHFYLRKKIDANRPPMIHTLRGAGYVLRPAAMSYPGTAEPGAGPIASAPRTSDVVSRPDPLGRHTLGRQLVVGVTALVALAALLITTATALATQQVLMSQLDRQLDAVTARVRDPVDNYIGSERGPDGGLLRPGQPIGTLAVIYDTDGNADSGGRLTERGAAGQRGAAVTVLPDVAVSQLAGVPTDGSKSSITLSELGHG